LIAQCAGIKRDGGRCKAGVGAGEQWCYNHDPARQDERKRNASRAGRSKPSKELQMVKTRLSDLAEEVLEKRVDRSDAAVASQVLNVYLRAIGMELKFREVEDVEKRLEELEEMMERNNRGRGYGS
jgi:hypothetical protein